MNEREREILKDKIKDIKFAMLTTLEPDNDLHTRPMATHEMDADGTLWFFTYADTAKVHEVERDRRIGLSYADPGSETYVAASGTSEVVRDQNKIHELWSDFLKAWFPNGKDDPQIALLKVKLHHAEYWDRPGGKMVKLFQLAKAYVTGEPDSGGRNEKLGAS
jgi:general stress protein 26